VLTTPELVRHILESIKDDDDPMGACNAVQSWCDTTTDNKVNVDWSLLTEQVFEDYVAPPQFEVYVHSPPQGYTRKGWFQELCSRHGRVLGQIKRMNYYTSRFYNTENQVKQLRHRIQTDAMQASDVRSMHEELARLEAILIIQKKEGELQDHLWNMMHMTFFSDHGRYFDDAIFTGGNTLGDTYNGLNKLDDDVFERQK
jgi:hypothetical protein